VRLGASGREPIQIKELAEYSNLQDHQPVQRWKLLRLRLMKKWKLQLRSTAKLTHHLIILKTFTLELVMKEIGL